MADVRKDPKTVFGQALEIRSADERAKFLDEACRGNASLREEVEDLLGAAERAGSFLGRDASRVGPTVAPTVAERPGTQIGPYKLLQQIGEGGMGVVYMAEQKEPVKRRVALKIIKPGMDTRQVIARFEAERQALAMMDHPNIAKVLDAGQTESGRPYFVMELVKGVPVTQYCDEQHLTPRERLELFVPICQAVQHAHQKGIIHRDIKPSNILVALFDGRPVPKVIDFGVAKATSQALTEKTMFTQVGQVVGTLEYMSPEQAQVNQLDVDTRSDIYSLGVLLYELLTGETPFDRERLRSAAFDEMLRIIREEEPSKPSTKVSSSQSLPSIAANRRMEPAKLGSTIRGELDWIVMKALEKDRGRRYDTASKFAEDVQHYLADEPVVACPPSAAYKFRKFARRNKAAIATTAAVALALVVGSAAATWQAIRATRAEGLLRAQYERERTEKAEADERRAALNRQINDGLLELQQQVTAAEQVGVERPEAWVQARSIAERVKALSENEFADPSTVQRVEVFLSRLDEQQRDGTLLARFDEARLKAAETDIGRNRFATERAIPVFRSAFESYGLLPEGISAAEAASLIGSRPEPVQTAIIAALAEWSHLLYQADEIAQATSEVRDWIGKVIDAADDDPWRKQARAAFREQDLPAIAQLAGDVDVSTQTPRTLIMVARILFTKDEHWDDGVALLQRAQQAYPDDFFVNEQLGELYLKKDPAFLDEAAVHCMIAVALRPNTAGARLNLGVAYDRQGKRKAAVAEYRAAIAQDPDYAAAFYNLGNVLKEEGELEEAVRCYRKAIQLAPKDGKVHGNLGVALVAQNKLDEGIGEIHRAIELDPKAAVNHNNLGVALADQGKLDEAVDCFRRAVDLDAEYVGAHFGLGNALLAQDKADEAVEHYLRAIELDPDNVQVHFNYGNALMGLGKLDEAIAQYRKAIDLDATCAVAYCALGVALADQGKLEEADTHYRRAIELDPKDALPHVNLGILLRDQGRLDEAIACFRAAIELDPGSRDAHYSLGVILADQGKLDEAIEHYRRAIELDPKCVPAHNGFGVALLKQHKLDEAIACFHKAIELVPEYAQAFRNLGDCLREKGLPEEAVDAYRRALDIDPNQANVHHNLAYALWRQGEVEEAVACFREAIELAPDRAMFHASLGDILASQGRFEEAIIQYRKTVELDPDNAAAHFGLGNVHMELGKREDAVEYYRKAIALDARYCGELYDIAQSITARGRMAEAIESLRVLTVLRPESYEYFNELGRLLRSARRWQEAEAAFQKCIQLDPEKGAAPFNLAGLYLAQRQPERAIQLMDAQDAGWPVLRGAALRQLGRLDAAIACLRQGLEEYKSKPDRLKSCRLQLAQAMLDKACGAVLRPERTNEELGQAEALAREALQVTPGPKDRGWGVLGLVQYRLGRLDDARQSLGKSLQANPDQLYALLTRSMIALDSGEQEAALEHWKKTTDLLAKRKSVSQYIRTLKDEVRGRLKLPEDAPAAP